MIVGANGRPLSAPDPGDAQRRGATPLPGQQIINNAQAIAQQMPISIAFDPDMTRQQAAMIASTLQFLDQMVPGVVKMIAELQRDNHDLKIRLNRLEIRGRNSCMHMLDGPGEPMKCNGPAAYVLDEEHTPGPHGEDALLCRECWENLNHVLRDAYDAL